MLLWLIESETNTTDILIEWIRTHIYEGTNGSMHNDEISCNKYNADIENNYIEDSIKNTNRTRSKYDPFKLNNNTIEKYKKEVELYRSIIIKYKTTQISMLIKMKKMMINLLLILPKSCINF